MIADSNRCWCVGEGGRVSEGGGGGVHASSFLFVCGCLFL